MTILFSLLFPLPTGVWWDLSEIHQKTFSKNVDVGDEMIRVAPAAATGRDREKLERARFDGTSSASLLSLPVQCSLKAWVPQILPPWKAPEDSSQFLA
jgi:hypothetical protein